MMVDTEHVLEQMRVANPAPSPEQLAVDDLDLVRDIVARGRFAMTTPVKERPLTRPDRLTPRRGMRPVLVAGLAFVLVIGTLGATVLLFRGDSEMATAGFTCPSGSTPDRPGPAEQPRPPQGVDGFTTFDPGSGRVLYLARDGFWMFDVCTNTWTTAPAPGDIGFVTDFVYDVDSDRAIVFASDNQGVARVGSYEPGAQTWTAKKESVVNTNPDSFISPWRKAAYDPVTGLVVVQEPFMSKMWTYDVDTDTWTEIDQAWPQPEVDGETFLTYDASVDRLVVYHPGDSTWEFDIRAGRWEEHTTNTPEIQGFGWWPTGEEFVYDEANQVSIFLGNGVTMYDASEHRWSDTRFATNRLYADDARRGGGAVPPMTYDPVSERIVMIVGDHYPWPGVIAYDVATGEWITLLEPTHS